MASDKELWGFNTNTAYNEYKKRLKGRIRSIENKGGTMYDGNAIYSKKDFIMVAVEMKNNKGLAFAEPQEIAKLVVDYQSYGNFTKEQAAILQEHYNKTHADKIDIRSARAKAAEISDFYRAERDRLIAEGKTWDEAMYAAKKTVSQVYFGSE